MAFRQRREILSIVKAPKLVIRRIFTFERRLCTIKKLPKQCRIPGTTTIKKAQLMTGSPTGCIASLKQYSSSAIAGLALFVIASYFTAIGSALLIIKCAAIGFILSAVATVLSAIGLYATSQKDNALKGRGIAFWTLLLSIVVMIYTGVAVVPAVFQMLG